MPVVTRLLSVVWSSLFCLSFIFTLMNIFDPTLVVCEKIIHCQEFNLVKKKSFTKATTLNSWRKFPAIQYVTRFPKWGFYVAFKVQQAATVFVWYGFRSCITDFVVMFTGVTTSLAERKKKSALVIAAIMNLNPVLCVLVGREKRDNHTFVVSEIDFFSCVRLNFFFFLIL